MQLCMHETLIARSGFDEPIYACAEVDCMQKHIVLLLFAERCEMAGFWDMVGKAANLVQLFGVDAITLITIVASCFWQFHEVQKECRKLEDSVRMLRLLLLSPAGCWIMQQQNFELLGHLVTNALMDADDLVRSFCESTPSLCVLRGRGMSRQFRDLRNSIDSYCHIILSIIVVVQDNPPPPPPPPPPPSSLVRAQVNHVGVPPSPGDSTSSSTAAPDHTHIIDINE
ncbi:hypothetical protein SETIT_8G228900v2 [Setaria italica]|uniref:Uncharacterized protein n=1 Tax=Setaria italica TaxID=4555 RepID=A0A368SAM0_SETIT|nr:protein MID1-COMPLEMENTING ACTIVITY 2-like [Setaria italica]RCV39495.1 hypothetical protein SETIT_8G228900v2 [Setaria italica]